MKKPGPKQPKSLSFKERRQIEADLGVYLSDPTRCGPAGQRFAVYDEDEAYVGWVERPELFTLEALLHEVRELFLNLEIAAHDKAFELQPAPVPTTRVHEDNR